MQPFYVAKKRTNNSTHTHKLTHRLALTHTGDNLGDSPFHMHFECPAAVKVKSAWLRLWLRLWLLLSATLFCCFAFAVNAIVCALSLCLYVCVPLCVCLWYVKVKLLCAPLGAACNLRPQFCISLCTRAHSRALPLNVVSALASDFVSVAAPGLGLQLATPLPLPPSSHCPLTVHIWLDSTVAYICPECALLFLFNKKLKRAQQRYFLRVSRVHTLDINMSQIIHVPTCIIYICSIEYLVPAGERFNSCANNATIIVSCLGIHSTWALHASVRNFLRFINEKFSRKRSWSCIWNVN